jgi:hypothetical protein
MTNDKDKGEKKTVTIIVNGTQHEVPKGDITFPQVVALASGLPTGPNILYTITFRKAEGNKPEGTLVEGGVVKVKEGTIFNVTATDKS